MGCVTTKPKQSSRLSEIKNNTAEPERPTRPARPEEIKDYSAHPDFIAFCNGQPQPDEKDPENQKKMWIASDFITMCLEAAGIVIEGNGRKEFATMDPEYRGIVRFKEFKKFCKHFRL